MTIQMFNPMISSLTVIAQILFVILLLALIFARKSNFIAFVSRNSLLFILIISLTATLGSLFYSEIVGYEPCKLCWLQRIFIFPQVLIAIIALLLKDKKANYYLAAMAFIAFLIATYHYLGQIGFTNLACDTAGYSVKCSERFVMNFGYITIPMMALSAIGLVLLIALAGIFAKPNK